MQSNEINEILPTSKALHISLDDNPNLAVYKKMERIIERMQKVWSYELYLLTPAVHRASMFRKSPNYQGETFKSEQLNKRFWHLGMGLRRARLVKTKGWR